MLVCTTVRLETTDGVAVIGRTMEFAQDLGWELFLVPHETVFVGTAPGRVGRKWVSRYGFAGVSALGRMSATDGINEAGLYAGLLYLPGYASYEPHAGVASERLVAPDEVASLVLATSASVAEALEAVASVVVWNRVEQTLNGVLPIHLVLHDRSGSSAVVEWVGGQRHVHDNPVGVCTNAPPFDWHLTNLRNYVNLSATNVDPVEIDGKTFSALGEGSGLLGLPGDWTPPSRFVRATILAHATLPVEGAENGMLTALHLMNAFDIPKGVVRGSSGGDYTAWTSVSDLTNNRYAIRTYGDPTPRVLQLAELNLAPGHTRRVPLPSNEQLLPLQL
jgi:choloylglycine hydrolase